MKSYIIAVDEFDESMTLSNKYDDSSVSYYGETTTMTESPDSSTEDEKSLCKTYSHDTITSLKGTYKCHADTIKMTECPLYEVINISE